MNRTSLHQIKPHTAAGIVGILLLLAPHSLHGAADASLTPSIFSPDRRRPRRSSICPSSSSRTGAIFAVVAGALAYVVIRFRQRANDDGKEPAQLYGSNPVEIAWTTVPVLIVVVLVLGTARVISQIENAPRPESAVDVVVIGHQ